MLLRRHYVGVGWGEDINVLTTTSLIVRPDDYVLDTTLSTICSLEDATCYYVLVTTLEALSVSTELGEF